MSATRVTKAPIAHPQDHRAPVAELREDLALEEPTDRGDAGAAFVYARLQLQQHIRALTEASEQGFALDMAIAAEQLEAAARELAANIRSLIARKARLEAQVQMALYECRALQETIAALFEACLRPASPRTASAWPDPLSPAESYPWLRRSLEHHAVLIERALSSPLPTR